MSRKEWLIATLLLAVESAILAAWGLLERWDLGESLGVAGLGLSVAGFAVALFAIQRAGSISRATQKAVISTLEGVAAGRLSVVITQLRQAVLDLETAIHDDDPKLARSTLNQWRHLGTDAEGLIKRRFGIEHPGLVPLGESIGLARQAKGALYNDGATVRVATVAALEAMESTSDVLSPLLEELVPILATEAE
jgi:hypothetical protein